MLISQKNSSFPKKFKWAKNAIRFVLSKFESDAGTRNGFPCVFAQNAVKRGNVQFLLIPYNVDNRKYELDILGMGLRECIEQINVDRLDINKHRPLLVLFEPTDTCNTTEDFRAVFVESMQYLIDTDEKAWVSHIPMNPVDPAWTMCFHGCELFVNVSHPAHALRRSRNMGEGLAFVINPRKIFDIAAPADRQGLLISEKIRANVDIYDDIPHSPLLGSYVLGEGQWIQYLIPDNNEDVPLTCPLHFSERIVT